jgi:hypothetical protein
MFKKQKYKLGIPFAGLLLRIRFPSSVSSMKENYRQVGLGGF